MVKNLGKKQAKIIWNKLPVLNTGLKIDSIGFSPDGKLLAGSHYNGRRQVIHIWNVKSKERIKTITLNEDTSIPIKSVAFSPDGKCVLVYIKKVYILGVESGKVETLKEHTDYVSSAAYSPDGKYVVSVANDKVYIWDVETGTTIKTLNENRESVTSVAYSTDGKYVVSGSNDRTVRIWDVESGTAIKTLNGHTEYVSAVAYSPDGKYVVSGSGHGTVRIWDIASGEEIQKHEGGSRVNSVAYSPDGKYVVSGSGKIHIWNTKTGKVQQMMEESTSSIAFSQDGIYIASTCSPSPYQTCTDPFKISIWKMNDSDIWRNYLRDNEGWDGVGEQDPRLMSPDEREEFLKWHPDNIMSNPNLPDSLRERWELDVKEPKSSEVLGNVKPLIDGTCEKIGKLYQKFEHDVLVELYEKLKT